MSTILAPTLVVSREEWPDADFDLSDDAPLHTHCNKSDIDEDWDVEMDLGKTGGAKAMVIAPATARPDLSRMITIRPPLPDINDEIDDEEGFSTIKASDFQNTLGKLSAPTPPADEDIEAAFALPSNLTNLSLASLSLNHRSSKSSLEWGEKEHPSSSQSSDAYSSLGFADASSSSNSTCSASMPNSDKDCDEDDESEIDGLVIPSPLFESRNGGRQLNQILETKKKAQMVDDRIKIVSPDPEDDFEIGLVIDDSADLSPSRLVTAHPKRPQRGPFNRSYSLPANTSPPLRLKRERPKSPNHPPSSSARQLSMLMLSPSLPLQNVPSSRPSPSHHPVPPSGPPVAFPSSKPGSLRGQKSHNGLKSPTSNSTFHRLARKASLASLLGITDTHASGPGPGTELSKSVRHETPAATTRAKSHKASSTGRVQPSDHVVPPTRPSTPSSNPIALRLTMPAASRFKNRPSLSSLFYPTSASCTVSRSASPLPSHPSSSSRDRVTPPLPAPKVLRRPRRLRTYGDGTELDAIEDLPTDREQEGRYRVQPRVNRVPGGSYSSIPADKGTIWRKAKREGTNHVNEVQPYPPSPSTSRPHDHSDCSRVPGTEILSRKKKNVSPLDQGSTRRKPTLIRNLGGAGAPKTVGDMKWNPQTLRWDGNDHVLRDFDVGTSTRPALITHLTSSSIGTPVNTFPSGARMVGNMIFDPRRMCWISTLPAEEDEPDVFANLADDEEDPDMENKCATLRPSTQLTPLFTRSVSSTLGDVMCLAGSHARGPSDSGSDRGSRASIVYDVDDVFVRTCRLAEARHRLEMKGWCSPSADTPSHLYDIRALATRQY